MSGEAESIIIHNINSKRKTTMINYQDIVSRAISGDATLTIEEVLRALQEIDRHLLVLIDKLAEARANLEVLSKQNATKTEIEKAQKDVELREKQVDSKIDYEYNKLIKWLNNRYAKKKEP